MWTSQICTHGTIATRSLRRPHVQADHPGGNFNLRARRVPCRVARRIVRRVFDWDCDQFRRRERDCPSCGSRALRRCLPIGLSR